jgi:hypothetical protein
MIRKLPKKAIGVKLVALLAPIWLSAEPNPQDTIQRATAQFVQQAPVLDGVLDDAAWADALSLNDFVQRDPQVGQPASEGTQVWVVYTAEAIYFGFVCLDSSPDQIVVTERRRDEDLTKDDSVAILLDTFLDRRNAYLFRINALGTQFDALVTDEGRDINDSWDEIWESSATVNPQGWSAEVMIPFESLRMREGETGDWGLEIERVIRRKNEAAYWNNFDRNFRFENVSQAGFLGGLEQAEIGTRFRFKPYLSAGFEQVPGSVGRTETDNRSDLGIEVFKYRPTRALTLDFTVNTDFAQSEVDDLVTNISRFPLFFPEKREFFLEGAGVFEFGTGQRNFNLFFSRRIGLSPEREVIPIIGGAKLTGRVGAYTLGIINMQTDSHEGAPGRNNSVFRIKRDLFGRSSVGAMFTNLGSGEGGDHNRVYGVDGNFVFAENLDIQTFVARSETPTLEGDEWAAFGRIGWDSDFVLLGAEHLLVQRNFNAELGFVPRRDQRATILQAGIRPRPDSSLIRQLVFRTRLELTQNQDGKQESLIYHYFTFENHFQSGDRIVADFHRRFERLFAPFDIRPGEISIPVGTYTGWDAVVYWDAAPQRRIAGPGLLRYRYEWGFFGGKRLELRIQPQFKISDALSVDLNYALDEVEMPWGDFSSKVMNIGINYAFSNRWLTSGTVQYSNLDQRFNFRFRLNYIYRPGDDLFLIYNEGRVINLDDPRDNALLGRSLIVKFTRSFDF